LWDGTKAVEQARRATEVLRNAGTIILAIDNAQDIPELRGHKGVRQVGSYIRDLVDKCHLVVVMLGTEDAKVVVQSNNQLRKRIPGALHLGAYDVTTKEGLAKFLRMVHLFDENLPLAECSGLAKGQVGKALAFASNGTIGCLADLLVLAIGICVRDGREKISLADLDKAYKLHFLGYADVVNPFVPGFNEWRRLDRPGEPHFVMVEEPPRSRRKGAASASQ
jgi:hypothetical protein